MDVRRPGQLGLFGDAPGGVTPARVPAEVAETGRALPEGVHLGTSSWSFPGWAGIVYERAASAGALARGGLAAYARHPVLRSVGIDRTYYGPLWADEFAAYAEAVPDGFRFLAKAHEVCTIARFPRHARYGERRGQPNPAFLDADYAREAVVEPFAEGLGAKAGPLVFQFPPQDPEAAGGPAGFAARLRDFLGALPRGPLYAVEIRNREWLTPAYADALASAGACHCVTVHPSMPGVEAQVAAVGANDAPAAVVRWMLNGRQRYDEARDRYAPFDRLVDEAPAVRGAIADLLAATARRGRPAFAIINNKAEGSAPLSAIRLAEAVVDRSRT